MFNVSNRQIHGLNNIASQSNRNTNNSGTVNSVIMLMMNNTKNHNRPSLVERIKDNVRQTNRDYNKWSSSTSSLSSSSVGGDRKSVFYTEPTNLRTTSDKVIFELV